MIWRWKEEPRQTRAIKMQEEKVTATRKKKRVNEDGQNRESKNNR